MWGLNAQHSPMLHEVIKGFYKWTKLAAERRQEMTAIAVRSQSCLITFCFVTARMVPQEIGEKENSQLRTVFLFYSLKISFIRWSQNNSGFVFPSSAFNLRTKFWGVSGELTYQPGISFEPIYWDWRLLLSPRDISHTAWSLDILW